MEHTSASLAVTMAWAAFLVSKLFRCKNGLRPVTVFHKTTKSHTQQNSVKFQFGVGEIGRGADMTTNGSNYVIA